MENIQTVIGTGMYGMSETGFNGGNGFRETILVVDDNSDARASLIDLLSLEGFAIIQASDGTSALEMIATMAPDLVLMDVVMPGMDGIETLRSIRQNPSTAELPVIMLTVLDKPIDMVQGIEMGATDYLTKPPQFEVLVAKVRTQLHLKRLQDQRRLDLIALQELNALKDKFLRIAAHDLKNPLNNITMGAEILSMSADSLQQISPELVDVVETISSSAALMNSIINDFLDFQAIQNGRLELNVRPIQIDQVIRSVLRQFKSYAENKQIAVHVELAENIPQTMADENRLMQVANNLIGNALKFSRKGSAITVRTWAGEGRIHFEVEDQGPGIPPEEIPMLFQEFSRLRNRPTGTETSSGLGLSIARHLVELHGGQIGVESQVGVGSVFWFEIPLQG
jgi:signal transduction histidine kinase